MTRRSIGGLALVVAAALLVATSATPASADDILGAPETTEPFGTFRGVDYVRHSGWLEGTTDNGAYRVPYLA